MRNETGVTAFQLKEDTKQKQKSVVVELSMRITKRR